MYMLKKCMSQYHHDILPLLSFVRLLIHIPMTWILRIVKIRTEYTLFHSSFATSNLISVGQHCDFELPTGLCVPVSVLAHMLLAAIADTIAVQTVEHLVLWNYKIILWKMFYKQRYVNNTAYSRKQYFNFYLICK